MSKRPASGPPLTQVVLCDNGTKMTAGGQVQYLDRSFGKLLVHIYMYEKMIPPLLNMVEKCRMLQYLKVATCIR